MTSGPSLFLLLLLPLPSLLLLLTGPSLRAAGAAEPPPCEPGRSWAVQLGRGGVAGGGLDELAHSVAQEAGLESRGQIGQLEGHYLFCPSPDGQADGGTSAAQVLAAHPHVVWHSQEQLLRRAKRSLAFNDPRYPKQWHLVRANAHLATAAITCEQWSLMLQQICETYTSNWHSRKCCNCLT